LALEAMKVAMVAKLKAYLAPEEGGGRDLMALYE
jgi:hypothetical protein